MVGGGGGPGRGGGLRVATESRSSARELVQSLRRLSSPAPLTPSRLSTQRGETALDFAKYNSNKGESIPLLDKVGRAAQPPDLAWPCPTASAPIPAPAPAPAPASAPFHGPSLAPAPGALGPARD